MSLQESAEMYLKTILILEKRNDRVRAIDIARQLEFSRPTVSQQVKNLAESGYLEVNNRKLISLTLKGREVAEEIYYRHSGLVDFLSGLGSARIPPWRMPAALNTISARKLLTAFKNI